jgi:peptide/nickel transport system substrate-binding protein
MRKRVFLVLAAVLVVSMLLAGCGSSQTTTATVTATSTVTETTSSVPSPTQTAMPTSTVKTGGVLTIIATENPSGALGIASEWGGLNSLFVAGTFERLLTYDTEGNIIPMLATGYEWSNNNLTLTLALRKGVKFHDGSDFNADAALWNIQYNIDAHVSGSSAIASLEKIDDYAIRINLSEYQNTWFASFCGLQQAPIGIMFSQAAFEKGKEYAEQNPVGTGPFKFTSYEVNQSLNFDRFDDYWGEPPLIDGYRYVIVTDPVTAELAFESGEGDAIVNISDPNQLVNDLSPKGYVWTAWPGMPWVLVPSSGNPDSPWSNQMVREAAEYAIDKEGICKSIFYGYSFPIYQMCTDWQLPYDADFEGRRYDPEMAKQLLSDAGYPNGFKTIIYCAEMFQGDAISTVQANLKAIGIDAELIINSVGKWIDMETNGWEEGLEFTALASNCPFDSHVSMFWMRPVQPSWGNNGSYWTALYRPPEIDDLVQACLTAMAGTPENVAVDKALVQFMYDNAMQIPLWQSQGAIVMKTYVIDLLYYTYQKTCSGSWNFTGVWLDK